MTHAELRAKVAGKTPAPTPQAASVPDRPLFRSLGEQLHAIARADSSAGTVDQRLYILQRRAAAAAGGSEMVPSDGGFIVEPTFSRQIVERMYETGEIFQRCMEVPVSGSGFKFPQFDESSRANGSRLGGIQVYWENEAASLKPGSLLGTPYTQKPSFNLSELVPNKAIGYIHVTDELSMDSEAFETWASYAFSRELMFALENGIVNGTGAGQPLGVMKSGALVTVAKETGQSAGTVVAQNINKMLASFWSKSYNSSGSVFLYNQALLPQLSTLATLVGTAGSESKLWQWATADDEYDLLAGFPAIQSEYCQYPGAPGDIILADFSRYIVAMREKFRAQVSIHVRFLSNESTFKFVMRVTGQPIDRSPVAALNGGSPPYQTSPFIALAPR